MCAGKKLRSFTGGVDDYAVGTAAIGGGALSWPVFKWSERCADSPLEYPDPKPPPCSNVLARHGRGLHARGKVGTHCAPLHRHWRPCLTCIPRVHWSPPQQAAFRRTCKHEYDCGYVVEQTLWLRRFVARLGKNAISVYEAPDMGLLDKKSFKLDGVQVRLAAAMLRC